MDLELTLGISNKIYETNGEKMDSPKIEEIVFKTIKENAQAMNALKDSAREIFEDCRNEWRMLQSTEEEINDPDLQSEYVLMAEKEMMRRIKHFLTNPLWELFPTYSGSIYEEILWSIFSKMDFSEMAYDIVEEVRKEAM